MALSFRQLYRLARLMTPTQAAAFRRLLDAADDPLDWYRAQEACTDCKAPLPPAYCHPLCWCRSLALYEQAELPLTEGEAKELLGKGREKGKRERRKRRQVESGQMWMTLEEV